MTTLLARRSPYTDLFSDFDSYFEQSTQSKNFLKVNISEDEKSYTLEALIPGYTSDDLSIEYQQGVIKISGKKQSSDKEKSYLRREFENSQFERSFEFTRKIESSEINAELREGILTLSLPKSSDELAKSIPIKLA